MEGSYRQRYISKYKPISDFSLGNFVVLKQLIKPSSIIKQNPKYQYENIVIFQSIDIYHNCLYIIYNVLWRVFR